VLSEGPVGRTLARLTVPMVVGIVGMVAFNLTDTFFVGRLGTHELAALSFTFPVVMVLTRITLGLGIGASAVISRAVGRGDAREVRRLTTDALSLGFLVAAVFIVAGYLTMDWIFELLGADGGIRPMVRRYMRIWYGGMLFVVFPMIANNAIRANGDTRTPALIMLNAVAVNIALDPLLIFGIGPFPRLELEGAALATVLTRAVSLCLTFYIVYFRRRMITFERVPLRDVLSSWGRILHIGVPAAATRVIVPLGIGVITGIISVYGPDAVAAFGVATKVEFFAMAVIFALASVLGPFTGQNIGAGKFGRVERGISLSNRFSLLWGLGMFVAVAGPARFIASLFSSDPDVVAGITLYVRTVSAAWCLLAVFFTSSQVMNVLRRPYHAAALAVVQTFVLTVPAAWLGSRIWGIRGIFAGIAVSYALSGAAAWLVLRAILRRLGREYGPKGPAAR